MVPIQTHQQHAKGWWLAQALLFCLPCLALLSCFALCSGLLFVLQLLTCCYFYYYVAYLMLVLVLVLFMLLALTLTLSILFSSTNDLQLPQHHPAEDTSANTSSASAAAGPSTQQDTSIYIGFKRIPRQDIISHDSLLSLIKPGNAAIIFCVQPSFVDKHDKVVAPIGHYTCAWKEEESEEDGYFYFDSKFAKVWHCKSSTRNQFEFQKPGAIRALFIFNLPLQLDQRKAAIKGALANLSARVNGILEHCLSLKEFDVSLPVDFFPQS